jgi:hypothetical protein
MTNREAILRLSVDTGEGPTLISLRDNDAELIRVDLTDRGLSDCRQRNAPIVLRLQPGRDVLLAEPPIFPESVARQSL